MLDREGSSSVSGYNFISSRHLCVFWCYYHQNAWRYFYTIGEFYMYFQVIATHNPQDFFCCQEPNDLTLTFIVKEDALMETVKQCVCGGYVAIVYPYELRGE
jgi:hypothetical protein